MYCTVYFVQILSEEINQLRMAHAVTIAKISEHKRKQIELGHRVLKVCFVGVLKVILHPHVTCVHICVR